MKLSSSNGRGSVRRKGKIMFWLLFLVGLMAVVILKLAFLLQDLLKDFFSKPVT